MGDYSHAVRVHSGNGPHEQMDGRAVAAFVASLDDVGISTEPRLRFQLIAWFTWATAMLNHRWTSPDDVPSDLPLPSWSWDGTEGWYNRTRPVDSRRRPVGMVAVSGSPMSSEQSSRQYKQIRIKEQLVTEPTTRTVDVPGATLTFDVHAPEAPTSKRPAFIFGSPMGAAGFEQLISHLRDRTVITYDPRGMDRSTREPGSKLTVEVHAEDYHRVIEAVGIGPVDAFGSSGGGMCGLHWVVAHPEDVHTFVSHEPPVITLLEDSQVAIKANADIVDTYQRTGFGPAMAKFIQLVMHQGLLPDDYLDRPSPDPAQFGLPTEDDGTRDDLLLSGNLAMPPFEPDAGALRASSVRIVPAIGALGEGGLARRGGEAVAQLLGVEPTVFPGDHGGFAANQWSPHNDPAAFAAKLRKVLDED